MKRESNRRRIQIVNLCAATSAAILLAQSHASAQTNLLLNPGFEPGIDGTPSAASGDVETGYGGPWMSYNNWGSAPYYSGYYTQAIPVHGGVQCAKDYGAVNAGIWQDVTVNAGDNYTASAWFVNSSANGGQDLLSGPQTDDIRMIFWSGPNATGNSLATDVSSPVSDLTPEDTWTQESITAAAPAGAESVQVMAFFNNPNNTGGALFVDDASLVDDSTPVGPPALTWNNSGGTGDGATWDIGTNQNWNNGTAEATYTDGAAVTFSDANNSHYAVTLNTTVKPASIAVTNNSGVYAISGSGSIAGTASLTKSGSGALTLATANTYSGGTTVTGGTLEIMRTSPTTSALPKGAVNITGGTLLLAPNATLGSQSSSTPASNINITSLSIAGNGALDINNNHIIIYYTAGNDPIASIAAWIHSGYASGAWTGPGIRSTSAASNASVYGIGYADAADAANPAGLASGQIEVMYTLLGDANLDGKVNGTDFAILATNFNQAVTSWDQGDFNYDGKDNGTDFAFLASNFNQGASQAADFSALEAFAAANGLTLNVPEPASAALLFSAGTAMLVRRRKRS